MFERDADVVFAAAGNPRDSVCSRRRPTSPRLTGRHLWAIGVDNDQWFDVGPDQQSHILTSVIKRGDVAAFRLVEHMLAGGPVGEASGSASPMTGFGYSQQGDGLTPEMVARLDEIMADIGEGRIEVPTIPTGRC